MPQTITTTEANSSQQVGLAIEKAQQSFSELQQYIETPDQQEWHERVAIHFDRVAQILRSVGSGTPIPDDWKQSQSWADIYVSMFLLVDAGWSSIRRHLRDRVSDIDSITPALFMAEIIRGHGLFWLSRAHKGEWVFPVKTLQQGLRNAKKLETTDRLDRKAYERLFKKVASTVEKRTELEFFAPHMIALLTCELAAKRDQRLRRYLNAYHTTMASHADQTLRSLRGGKGFGFRNGDRLVAAPGGSYKKREVSAVP
ncbi:hypothetical protein [Leptolyngbya ohadii]|uniref:hypothetical protein n=1 Tax=Leptolyngbya ohadii TaxID=1962290 RepID=UPI000B59DFEC|nr:hypothetical protein [Leptolyngbya ohadii]